MTTIFIKRKVARSKQEARQGQGTKNPWNMVDRKTTAGLDSRVLEIRGQFNVLPRTLLAAGRYHSSVWSGFSSKRRASSYRSASIVCDCFPWPIGPLLGMCERWKTTSTALSS
eukprot:6473629-Amphidinium_carterae.1